MWPNPQFPADLITFTGKILNESFIFSAVAGVTTWKICEYRKTRTRKNSIFKHLSRRKYMSNSPYIHVFSASMGNDWQYKILYSWFFYVVVVLHLLGHFLLLHNLVSTLWPSHSFPPWAGLGFVHVRVLNWVPPPHFLLHIPKCDHRLKPPSTV